MPQSIWICLAIFIMLCVGLAAWGMQVPVAVHLDPATASITLRFKDLACLSSFGLQVWGSGYHALATPDAYSPAITRIVSSRKGERAVEIVARTGIGTATFTYCQLVESIAGGVRITYEVVPSETGIYAFLLTGTIPITEKVTETRWFADGRTGKFPDKPGEALNLCDGKHSVGYILPNGVRVEFSAGSGVSSIAICDLRRWHAGFAVRCFSEVTGGNPSRHIERGKPVRLTIAIKVNSVREAEAVRAERATVEGVEKIPPWRGDIELFSIPDVVGNKLEVGIVWRGREEVLGGLMSLKRQGKKALKMDAQLPPFHCFCAVRFDDLLQPAGK